MCCHFGSVTVEDIQMFFAEPVDITLRNSLDVMTTKGEWELVNMVCEKNLLQMENTNTSFDLLIYYVRHLNLDTFCYS